MVARTGVRGLRVEEVAAEADVAVSLIYYHFGSRDGLVRAALDHANEIASANISRSKSSRSTGYEQVVDVLEDELADSPSVRELSIVWGEVLATAVFEPQYREQIVAADRKWVQLVTDLIARGQEDGSVPADLDRGRAAESLTIFVDGLSSHWLAGLIDHDHALRTLRETAAAILGRPGTGRTGVSKT